MRATTRARLVSIATAQPATLCRFVGAPTCDEPTCPYCYGDSPLELDPDALTARGVRTAAIVALGWASPREVAELDDEAVGELVKARQAGAVVAGTGPAPGLGGCGDPYCIDCGENIEGADADAHELAS